MMASTSPDNVPDNAPDNCPIDANTLQTDSDSDDVGDICDICPADPGDSCDPNSSAAEEVTSAAGGEVATADGILSLGFDAGDVAVNTTITASSAGTAATISVELASGTAIVDILASYELQPDGG